MKNDSNNETHKDGTKVRENNRILRGILLLALLIIAGFALTWAFPRNVAEKPAPPQVPKPAPTDPSQDTTEIIIQRVTSVEGVEEAQVIVLSRIALIALDLDPEITATREKEIKNEIAARVKDVPEVDEVLVTANPGLFEELRKILEGDMPLERLEYIYESIRDQNL